MLCKIPHSRFGLGFQCIEISGSCFGTVPICVELAVPHLPPEESPHSSYVSMPRGLIRALEALFLVYGIPRSAGKLETHVPFITLSGRSRW